MKNEVVIIDTEYTTWEGAMESGWAEDWQHREIVQIAAVKLDLDTGGEAAVLDVLVRPRINPDLSGFFTELTGITQEQIEHNGYDYAEALAQLYKFCRNMPASRIISYGRDENILMENCELYGVEYPFKEEWKNLRPALAAMGVDHTKYNSGELHTLTDTPLEGRTHYALHDVRSIGVFLRYQIAQGHGNVIEPLPHK